MTVIKFEGILACLGRRAPSPRWGKARALHSTRGELMGRLRGLGRRDA